VLRRRCEPPAKVGGGGATGGQLALPGVVVEHKRGEWYEHAVLVTNWAEPSKMALAQIYRDRADAENMFDELKNQWGWTGFTTADLKRSQLMARMVALIFNWWSIFTRMATGPNHREAITTRPLLQNSVAHKTRHSNQTRLSLSSLHGKARLMANLLHRISGWLAAVSASAEQLSKQKLWRAMLRRIFQELAGFKFSQSPSKHALVPDNCRI